MPRKSIPSTTIPAAVRKYLGLEQQELAAYLGISAAQVGHIEAGRRILTGKVLLRLAPLAALLPGPEATPAPALPEAAPDPAPLDARRDFCAWKARSLRYRLRPLEARAALARRWQQALPSLLAAAPAGHPTHAWLLRRQEQAALELGPTAVAERLLLRLQAEALETEAAALAALLISGSNG